jgi:hypothetical protein
MSEYESSDSEFESIPINKSDPLATLKKLVESRIKTARQVKNSLLTSQKSRKRTFESESEEEEEEKEEVEVRNQHFTLVALDEETERSTRPTAALAFKAEMFKRTKRGNVLDGMIGKRSRNGTSTSAVPLHFCRDETKKVKSVTK